MKIAQRFSAGYPIRRSRVPEGRLDCSALALSVPFESQSHPADFQQQVAGKLRGHLGILSVDGSQVFVIHIIPDSIFPGG